MSKVTARLLVSQTFPFVFRNGQLLIGFCTLKGNNSNSSEHSEAVYYSCYSGNIINDK
jgi:hypothetical protein